MIGVGRGLGGRVLDPDMQYNLSEEAVVQLSAEWRDHLCVRGRS